MSTQQVDGLVETYKTIISDNGGSVGKTEYWGLRPIAFRMKKNRKAHYTLMNLTCPPAAVAEMERQMSLSEDVVRFLTLRVDELEEGQSAMMRRDSRDDCRGPRREGERDRGDRDRGDRDRGDRDRRPPRSGDRPARDFSRQAG
mgnify:CR=1 FL=1